MDVGSPAQRHTFTEWKRAVVVCARSLGKGHVDGDGHCGANGERRSQCAAQGFFFLYGRYSIHIPGMVDILQFVQAGGDGSHGSAVIQGVPGQGIPGQFHRLLVKRDQVAGAYQFFDFIWPQTGIDEQIFDGDGFIAQFRFECRHRRYNHHAGQRAAAMHQHRGSGQNAWIDAADPEDTQQPINDGSDDQANCIHVSGKQDARAGFRSAAAPQAVQAADTAGGQFINQGSPGIGDQVMHRSFVSG
jgi:hypothetical protein